MIRGTSTTAPGLAGAPVYCSWSGGKDLALALHEAIGVGAEPRFLVSMLTEGGERSRSHGLPRVLLAAQAAAIGMPIRFGAATWDRVAHRTRKTRHFRLINEARPARADLQAGQNPQALGRTGVDPDRPA